MYSEQKRERERLRGIWRGMIARCTNSNHQSFNHYGMRGIRVCDDWNNSFDSFYKWSISSGCSNDLSIDRINVNGNYEPSNCRWATCSEQSNNKTNNRIIEYLGVRKTVSEWAHECGIPYMIFYRRIFYDNWPTNKALSEPKGTRFNKDWVIDKNEPLIDNRKKEETKMKVNLFLSNEDVEVIESSKHIDEGTDMEAYFTEDDRIVAFDESVNGWVQLGNR